MSDKQTTEFHLSFEFESPMPDPIPDDDELPAWLWLLIVCVGFAVLAGVLWLVDWMFR